MEQLINVEGVTVESNKEEKDLEVLVTPDPFSYDLIIRVEFEDD